MHRRGAATSPRGTNGTLRADYNGEPIQLADPTIDQFFNTAAFAVPAAGTFGNAPRNMIIGPGSRQLNAQFSRDMRLGGNRARHAPGERDQPAQHGELRRRSTPS